MKHLFTKFILSFFISSIAVSTISYGQTSYRLFPRGCEATDFVFYQTGLVLNRSGKQTFYLLHNKMPEEIKLEHIQTELLSPSLSINLMPGYWSAFATDIQDLRFQCHIITQGLGERLIDCGTVLEICQYPRVKFSSSNQGSYWVGINNSREQVISGSSQQGIYLKW